jgi:hypothetical protein
MICRDLRGIAVNAQGLSAKAIGEVRLREVAVRLALFTLSSKPSFWWYIGVLRISTVHAAVL